MKDLRRLARELEQSGRGGAIRELAGSPEGRRIGSLLDAQAAEKALQSGDTAALRQMLAGVLATDEGRTLAEKLRQLMEQR